MEVINLEDVSGTEFPAGRLTRVIIGPGSKEARNFVMGYVTIFPQGKVPLHSHKNEEVYTIIQGSGIMKVGKETQRVSAVSSIYIPSNVPHSLVNEGQEDLVMIFVYSPAGVMDHWDEESKVSLK